MKQNLSTTTSVPTDINDGRQYVFMSSDLESSINFENPTSSWSVSVKLSETEFSFPIVSIEDEGSSSYVICLSVNEEIGKLTRAMLNHEKLVVTLLGEQFKSKVLKLESGKAYLKILR